jgi:F-type H+-transporting ATPase subunit epsilon
MANAAFPVAILTPEGEVFNGAVERVSTRTTLGLIGIMARHAPLLATLEPTELRLIKPGGEVTRYAQSEGYLQVGGNRALLLLTEVLPLEGLDVEMLRERLRTAEEELAAAGDDAERRRNPERDKRRYEVFISLAK